MYDPVGRLLAQRAELKITDDQAQRLEAIRTKYLARSRSRSEDVQRNREARSKFRASMDSTRTEVMAVLTPEQQQKLTKLEEEFNARQRELEEVEKKQGGAGGGGGAATRPAGAATKPAGGNAAGK